MLTSGLTNAPLTKFFLVYIIASSVALSILDIKYLGVIHVDPHLWPYAQFWRALIWQIAGFTNSTEALFAALLVYHLRVVERAWGKRKMATFLLATLPYTTLLPPLLLVLIARPLSLGKLNYLPSGPITTIFALLVQYHATIPHVYRYRIGTTSTPSTTPENTSTPPSTTPKSSPTLSILLSDKSTTYLVASQLALSQFPAMLLPAAAGWIVGVAWRAELLPGLSSSRNGFRVPAWMVGERERRSDAGNGGAAEGSAERERYEDLRRRLEGEAASASGIDAGAGRRRNGGADGQSQNSGFLDRLRSAW